ncbi:MAG: right-handed parallel beta-helix repeat-containing protein [Saprospiraceae bacterium]|nr:right-handed parallel beta-helix repeat-containing protein [Saprospiraceae bacterium]
MRTNTAYYPQFGAFPFGANGVAVYALGGPAYEVLRVTNNSIKQCRFGVLAGRTTPRLQNNALSQAEFGLFAGLLGPHGGTVTDNTLEDITTAGIWINENTPGGNLTITGNAVNKTGTGPGAGILLYHVGGHAASETALVSENPVTVAGGSGIYALSCSQVVVRDNDEIALDNTATCRAGILLEGCQEMLLVDNTVTGAGTGGSQNTGIEIASSPGNIYCCNDVDNTRLGVSVAGGSLSENNFRGTMFGDHATSLYLPNSAAILGSQVHTENRWQGSGGAVYDVLGDYAQLYSFSVDASGLSGNLEFMPASVTPPEWFDDLENSNPQTVCAPENCEVDGLVADSPDSKRIASGDIDAGDYTYTIVWELQRYLYRQLQGWSGQDSVIQAFMAASAGNTIGDFQAIDEAIEAMFNADTAEIATLKANLDLVIVQLDSLLSLDRMLVNASAPEVPALMTQREILIDSLLSLAEMNVVLTEVIEENRADAAAAAGALNAGITTTQDFEENEQTVNEVYLSWVEKGWQNLTGTEKAALEVVAMQCPLLGGNAVYRARSLLSAAKGTLLSYDDSTACAGNEAFFAPPQASTLTLYSEQELSVYPNPANDIVILTWRAPIVHAGTLRLYDLYGRQSREIALSAGVSMQYVNIRDLYGGIYILRVELDGRTYTKKIAVKH